MTAKRRRHACLLDVNEDIGEVIVVPHLRNLLVVPNLFR
jgi:hypothetical protein